MALTWQDLDDIVEGDPLILRDRAWAEIERLRGRIDELAPAHEHMAHTSPGCHPLGAVGECECGERFRVVKLPHAVLRSWEPVR